MQRKVLIAVFVALAIAFSVVLTVYSPSNPATINAYAVVYKFFENETLYVAYLKDDGFAFAFSDNNTLAVRWCNFTHTYALFNVTLNETITSIDITMNQSVIISAIALQNYVTVLKNESVFTNVSVPGAHYVHVAVNASYIVVAFTTQNKYSHLILINESGGIETEHIYSANGYRVRDISVCGDLIFVALTHYYYYTSRYLVFNRTSHLKTMYRWGRVVDLYNDTSLVQYCYYSIAVDKLRNDSYSVLAYFCYVRYARSIYASVITCTCNIIFFANRTDYVIVSSPMRGKSFAYSFYIVVRNASGIGVITFDYDNDGLLNIDEVLYGTDIYDTDTDGDNVDDRTEIAIKTNPLSADSDGDTLSDYYELFISRTDPLSNDTDADGVNDNEEITLGTNPNDNDTDTDGIEDGNELSLGTDPCNYDTDGDMLPDGAELSFGSDPLLQDTDNDNVSDFIEYAHDSNPNANDTDDDGLSDYEENYITHTNPCSNDTDADGWNDYYEVNVSGTDPNNPDTDGDGILDPYDSEITTQEEHGIDWITIGLTIATIVAIVVILYVIGKTKII